MAVMNIDEGLPGLLKQRNGSTGALTVAAIRLYTAISPALSKGSVLANFTQMTGMGYGAFIVSGATWAYSALDTVGHKQTGIVVASYTFTAGAGATILGWYATDSFASPTKVLFAEQFSSSVIIPAGGGTFSITWNDDYQGCA